MASTDISSESTSRMQSRLGVDMKLEVVTLPVSDVDRAKDFYQRLGWRLDADFDLGGGKRAVQFTPPHSQCSIAFGTGLTTVEAGSAQRMELAVSDINAARDDLVSRGVEVSEVFHNEPGRGPVPGLDPEHRSYLSLASFTDPDGNGWLLQEITTRLPGREWRTDVDIASLADLLHETAARHGSFEAVAPAHDWWDWYAAYMDARERGGTPGEASSAAGSYMAEVKHVVVSPA